MELTTQKMTRGRGMRLAVRTAHALPLRSRTPHTAQLCPPIHGASRSSCRSAHSKLRAFVKQMNYRTSGFAAYRHQKPCGWFIFEPVRLGRLDGICLSLFHRLLTCHGSSLKLQGSRKAFRGVASKSLPQATEKSFMEASRLSAVPFAQTGIAIGTLMLHSQVVPCM